jgi:hypothetical protein
VASTTEVALDSFDKFWLHCHHPIYKSIASAGDCVLE